MSADNLPRFGGGHMCACCPFEGTYHSGCVVGGNVVVVSGEVQIYRRPSNNGKLDARTETVEKSKNLSDQSLSIGK